MALRKLFAEHSSWVVSWASLFASFGTLLCCALPTLLVALGMGVTLVGILGAFPQLIWLSERKSALFGLSLGMLAVTFFVQRWSAKRACPIQAEEACEQSRRWSHGVFWIAVAINVFGIFFTYVLPQLGHD